MVRELLTAAFSRLLSRAIPLALPLTLTTVMAQRWEFEQVDTGRMCFGAQIERAPDGKVYVCYGRTDTTLVRIAWKDTVWHHQDIDSLPNPPNLEPSFAIGPRSKMAVSYQCVRVGARFIEHTDSVWTVSTLPFPAQNPRVGYDSAGTPWIAFVRDSEYSVQLGLARRADTSWSVHTTTVYVSNPLCYVQLWTSPPCFDQGERPNVLFCLNWYYNQHVYGGYLALVRLVGESWEQTWERDVAWGDGPSMAFDPSGKPWRSYSSTPPDSLCCDDAEIDQYSAVTATYCDAAGRVQVAGVRSYFPPHGGLGYSLRRDSTWSRFTVVDSGVTYCDMILDPAGEPLIAYAVQSNGVWLAHGIGVVGAEEPELPATTARDLLLSVHPNPCRGWARIELSGPVSGDFDLRLFDVSGRVVQPIQVSSGARSASLDMRAIPAGVYFIGQVDSRGSSQARIVKVE